MKEYNADGIDLDIEGHSVVNAGNLVPAVKRIMDYFIDEGTPKMLTMAPEFPHMRTNG
jgi:chitinase